MAWYVRYKGNSRPGETFLSVSGARIYCAYDDSVEVSEGDLAGLLAQTGEWEAANEETEAYTPTPQRTFRRVLHDIDTGEVFNSSGTDLLPVAQGETLGDATEGQVPVAQGDGSFIPGVTQTGALTVSATTDGRLSAAVESSQVGVTGGGVLYFESTGAASSEAARLDVDPRAPFGPPLYSLTQTGV